MTQQRELTDLQQRILNARKKARAEAEEEMAKGNREFLLALLQHRFPTISDKVQQRIAAASWSRLLNAIGEVFEVSSPEELPL